jgi:SAM-dependent methyltransferase
MRIGGSQGRGRTGCRGSWLGMWMAGLHVGISTVREEPVLGLKRLVLPVSYWRAVEFSYVWRHLSCGEGARVLDLGSPKDLAIFLARYRKIEMVAVDILPRAVALSKRYAAAQRLDGKGVGMVRSEQQDGRHMSYDDGCFDAAFSVSVLEHIPDGGDTDAVRELVRVVKPGGLILFTVPYDVGYRETFVNESVYERAQQGSESVFFERHYDEKTLHERLLSMPGTRVIDVELWGEGAIRVEHFLNQHAWLRNLISPIEVFLAAIFLRRISPKRGGRPMAAFATLQKVP